MLTCLSFEHAVPFFMIQTGIIEVFDSKGETGEKDAKIAIDDLISLGDHHALPEIEDASLQLHTGSLCADSEEIPDSAHQSIFSPPPNEA